MSKNCPDCRKEFISVWHLNKHVTRKVSCIVGFPCKLCEYVFKNKEARENHKTQKLPCVTYPISQDPNRRVKLVRDPYTHIRSEIVITGQY